MNRQSLCRLCFVPILFVLFLGYVLPESNCSAQARGNDGDVNLDTIIRAWEGRQASTSSLDISCSGTEFLSKASAVSAQKKSKQSGGKIPYDITYASKIRYVFDANKRTRLEHQAKEWSTNEGDYVDRNSVEVLDGKTRQSYYPSNAVGFRNAHIRGPNRSGRDARILPLFLVYQPFELTGAQFDPKNMTFTSSNKEGGSSYLTLRHHSKNGDELIVVDKSKDYVPVHYTKNLSGKKIREISIEFNFDAKHGWVPSSWKNVWTDASGRVRNSVNASVVAYKINESVGDDTFKITYEPPTWVSNYIDDERYIVRENDIRPIRRGEYNGHNFLELAGSDPQTGPSFSLRLTVIIVSLLAIIAGVAYWRLKRAA